jgi:hypothetical protein
MLTSIGENSTVTRSKPMPTGSRAVEAIATLPASSALRHPSHGAPSRTRGTYRQPLRPLAPPAAAPPRRSAD